MRVIKASSLVMALFWHVVQRALFRVHPCGEPVKMHIPSTFLEILIQWARVGPLNLHFSQPPQMMLKSYLESLLAVSGYLG